MCLRFAQNVALRRSFEIKIFCNFCLYFHSLVRALVVLFISLLTSTVFMMILFKLVIFAVSFSFTYSISSGEPPRLNKVTLSNITTAEGTFQAFMCSINLGALPVTFTYLHNGKPISEESSDVKIDTSNAKFSFLTLHHIRRSDGGVYSCVAKNRFGSDSATWTLTVNGNVASV